MAATARPYPNDPTAEFIRRAVPKGQRTRSKALNKAVARGKNPFAKFPKLLQAGKV